MKYWVAGAIILVLIIIILVARNTAKTSAANAQIIATNQQVSALNGATPSQVAQIINSIFPYFNTGITAATGDPCPTGYVLDNATKKCIKVTV